MRDRLTSYSCRQIHVLGQVGVTTMANVASTPCLSAVFVDYDNIYLSLKRRNEELAKRFARDALVWLKEIETGRLITPTNGPAPLLDRRLVMNRCYGNPVPRRNSRDNSTDMSSFPFIRHHFLRAGFEIVDCPPLTAQLKNSSDIRMVMDVRDFLTHDTYFDEFVILSGDADFTPVLHRLRAHARRTVIYANEFTAQPYTAICDGEIQEDSLVALLADGAVPSVSSTPAMPQREPSEEQRNEQRTEIAGVVERIISESETPVPIETLADKAQRELGHDRTIGTAWGGHGAFRTFLAETLADRFQLTDQAPYFAFEPGRHENPEHTATKAEPEPAAIAGEGTGGAHADAPESARSQQPDLSVVVQAEPEPSPGLFSQSVQEIIAPAAAREPVPQTAADLEPAPAPSAPPPPSPAPAEGISMAPAPQGASGGDKVVDLNASIARIQEACQAPPLGPQQYSALFAVLAEEINENGLSGAQTITNIVARAKAVNLDARRDDVRFILDVVSEADPWFEQGASANIFAGRFRNFVVARCRGQGLSLSAEEIDLIDAWFAGGALTGATAPQDIAAAQSPGAMAEDQADQMWSAEEQRLASGGAQAGQPFQATGTYGGGGEDFSSADVGQMPRFVRSQAGG